MNSLFQQALSVFLCDFVDVLNFVPLPAILTDGTWPRQEPLHVFRHVLFPALELI